MTESIRIVDIVVEYTDDEGEKSKVVVNDLISNNLGEILEINDYMEKIKSVLSKP
jgi:hypothetical protein